MRVRLAVAVLWILGVAGAEAKPAVTITPLPRAKPALHRELASPATSPTPTANPLVPAGPIKLDGHLADWVNAAQNRDASSAAIAAAIAAMPDWPGQALLQLRYEQALKREAPKPDIVVAAFAAAKPVSTEGTLLLAKAFVALGRKSEAAGLVRNLWRQGDLTEAGEKSVLADFGDLLTADDHRARVDRLLYAGRAAEALRNAKLLDKALQASAEARAAVIRGKSNAGKLLEAVPESVRNDPGFMLARVQYLRRAAQYPEAAQALLDAPTDPAVLVNPDVWSEERREVARRLIDLGEPETAYRIVDAARARSQTPRVEAEFEAGWYALRFLHQPGLARPHFQAILDGSSTPISQARGFYWLGRAAEAEGNDAEAAKAFAKAASFSTAFYGQIAAAKLKQTDLALAAPPAADEATAARFAARELVKSIIQLRGAGRDEDAAPFYRQLANTLIDPAELALLAGLAEAAGNFSTVVEIGKAAQARGIPVGTLAFPATALPPYSGPAKVDAPVLYAIARQESTFDQRVVSSAGAVGILQVMPQYVRETAQKAGIPYYKDRVKTDRDYNIQIGAAELADRIDDYGGSYLLAFAAYNAGPGSVAKWIKAYGDPRDPSVDVLDWIERIPFSETRNYVQRALENLQVYRARLEAPGLRIEADLVGTRTASGAGR